MNFFGSGSGFCLKFRLRLDPDPQHWANKYWIRC
jgi:hypothetical protein